MSLAGLGLANADEWQKCVDKNGKSDELLTFLEPYSKAVAPTTRHLV